MNDHVTADEAANALAEVGRRQEQVINLSAVPAWFWPALGVLMVGFAAAMDSGNRTAVKVAIPVFVAGVVTVTTLFASGMLRRARPHEKLIGPVGVLKILTLVAVTVVSSLATSFAAKAGGFHWSATLGTGIGALIMIAGGPLLSRALRKDMLARRVGAR
jgi:hypothetical protein